MIDSVRPFMEACSMLAFYCCLILLFLLVMSLIFAAVRLVLRGVFSFGVSFIWRLVLELSRVDLNTFLYGLQYCVMTYSVGPFHDQESRFGEVYTMLAFYFCSFILLFFLVKTHADEKKSGLSSSASIRS